MIDDQNGRVPIESREYVEALLERVRDVIAVAGDCAARYEMEEVDEDGRAKQHAVFVLDPQDETASQFIEKGVALGRFPAVALESMVGVVVVLDLTTARKIAESSSGVSATSIDQYAVVARATRGMLLFVMTCGAILLACLPRVGVEHPRA